MMSINSCKDVFTYTNGTKYYSESEILKLLDLDMKPYKAEALANFNDDDIFKVDFVDKFNGFISKRYLTLTGVHKLENLKLFDAILDGVRTRKCNFYY